MTRIYEALKRHEAQTVQPMPPPKRLHRPNSPIATALEQAYQIIYRQVADAGHGLVLHFVAPTRGEGVSTLSNAFAHLAASAGDMRVLLLDADRTALTTAKSFGCDTDHGIYDEVLKGSRIDGKLINTADNSRLYVGTLCGRLSPALSRKSLRSLYDQLRSSYDLTILDCPAVLSEGYFELSPETADGVVMIVQAERSRPVIIRQAQSRLQESGTKTLGAILNRRHRYIPDLIYRLL